MTVALPQALGVDLRGRSLARVRDWTAAEIEAVLDLADELKAKQRAREPHRLLEGRTLGLLFRKHSTRTRVSLEVAAAHLGATALYLPDDQLQLARGEPFEDTARVLSRYLDAIAIRTYLHAELEVFAAAATVPVVNALTDEAHPLQALADLQTIRERFGALEGLRVAWVGDGNNVCVSLAEACALLGAELVCAAPPGYEPDDASIPVVRDPREAVAGAHVVVTDVWTSMGQEAERDERLRAFAGYTVDDDAAGAGRSGGDRAPLPAGASRRGDRRGRALRPPLRRLGRGREPPPHGQGAADADRLDEPAPAREDVLEVGALRVRHEHEQPVAGLDHGAAARGDRVVATRDHRDQRVARQAQLPDRGAGDGVVAGDARSRRGRACSDGRPRAARRAPAAPARAAEVARRPTRASCPARSPIRRRRRRRR